MIADVSTGEAPDLASLPVLGVGASLSFGAQPDPVALAAAPGGPSFIEYAGAVQHSFMREPLDQLRKLKIPLLYHPSCLNLCGPYPNPLGWLAAVNDHVRAVGSAWLAQDVATCFIGDEPGYSIQLGYFLPPVFTRDSLDEAVVRVGEVRRMVRAPLLLEPAPITFVVGDMDSLAWLGELAERSDCGLLLDAGHLVSHNLAAGRAAEASPTSLPLERVIEVHIAGGVLREKDGKRYYIDAHELPVLPETRAIFGELLRLCPNLRAVCVECEGAAAQSVLPALRRARERVAMGAANPALRERARAELAKGGAS